MCDASTNPEMGFCEDKATNHNICVNMQSTQTDEFCHTDYHTDTCQTISTQTTQTYELKCGVGNNNDACELLASQTCEVNENTINTESKNDACDTSTADDNDKVESMDESNKACEESPALPAGDNKNTTQWVGSNTGIERDSKAQLANHDNGILDSKNVTESDRETALQRKH